MEPIKVGLKFHSPGGVFTVMEIYLEYDPVEEQRYTVVVAADELGKEHNIKPHSISQALKEGRYTPTG